MNEYLLFASHFTSNDTGVVLDELKFLGFSAGELNDAKFKPKDVINAGFSVSELKGIWFSAKDVINAEFLIPALKDAGYTLKNLVTLKDICSIPFTLNDVDKGYTLINDEYDLD